MPRHCLLASRQVRPSLFLAVHQVALPIHLHSQGRHQPELRVLASALIAGWQAGGAVDLQARADGLFLTVHQVALSIHLQMRQIVRNTSV